MNKENFRFLSVFCDWIEYWNCISGTNIKFTTKTFTTLHYTTYIIKQNKYCIEELKILYILPGKFQTDHLEARFGQTVNEVGSSIISRYGKYLSVKKIRILSILKLSQPLNLQRSKIDLKNLQKTNWDKVTEEQKWDVYEIRTDVNLDDLNKCRVVPVILYLISYCHYAVLKKIKGNSCKDLIYGRDNGEEIPEINSCFQEINRGSPYILMIQQQILFTIIMQSLISW